MRRKYRAKAALVARPDRRKTGLYKAAAKIALVGGKNGYLYRSPKQPWCDNPRPVFMGSDPEKPVAEVLLYAPCRRCEKCLTFKALQIRDQAMRELALAKRTWFVTLTFDEGNLLALTGKQYRERGPKEKRLEKAAYRYVQRWLKRLRRANPLAKLRYLAVFELGDKTGRPHFHVLLHETGMRPITKRSIEDNWTSPIVHARLVQGIEAETRHGLTSNVARYVTKYLVKNPDCRKRASQAYGALAP